MHLKFFNIFILKCICKNAFNKIHLKILFPKTMKVDKIYSMGSSVGYVAVFNENDLLQATDPWSP
jgi:hypothetical protein